MKVGFIGLGSMGLPMARNLIQAGHEVFLYNRTRSRAEELAREGGHVVNSPAEAAAAGVVMTMVADDRALDECVFGDRGILAALPVEGVHITTSTISTALSRRLEEAHQERGQSFVAAPVFGRPEAAKAARLVVVAAGPVEAIERCRPLLEAVGKKLFVVGPHAPAANTVKIAGNFLIAAMLEGLGEAFALVRKAGIGPVEFLEVVNGSLFQSPIYENYGRLIAEQRYEPAGFKLRLGLKDVRLALAAAEEAAVPMPLASLVHDHLLAALARGHGEKDWAALARIVAESAGLEN